MTNVSNYSVALICASVFRSALVWLACSVSPSFSSADTLRYFKPESFPTPIRALAESTLKAARDKDESSLQQISSKLNASNFGRGLEDERLFLLGFTKVHLGQVNEAIPLLRSSVAIRNSNPEAQYYLLLALKRSKQCLQVINEVENLKWLVGKSNYEVLILQVECLVALEKTEESNTVIAELTKVAQKVPEARQWLLRFKRNELSSGQIDANSVGVDLKEAAESNPEDFKVQALYARSLLKKGDRLFSPEELKQAEVVSRKAFEKSGYKDEHAFKTLFDVMLKMRRYSDAEDLLEQAYGSLSRDNATLIASQKQLDIERKGLDTLRFQLNED